MALPLPAFRKALEAALEGASKETTVNLRRQAFQAGWPSEHAQRIRADLRSGEMDLTCEGAEDWEYGTEDRPPTSIVRAARIHHDEHIDPIVNKHLDKHLGDLL